MILVYAVGACSVNPFGQIFLGDSIYFSSFSEPEGFQSGNRCAWYIFLKYWVLSLWSCLDARGRWILETV